MVKKLLVLVALTFVASAAALLVAGPAEPAGAQVETEAKAACPNPGLYTGRSTSGNFQDALEAAVDEAEACAGCCDLIVSYGFIEAEGERGGFLFRNNLDVTIKASW